jgi:hypothetical protein
VFFTHCKLYKKKCWISTIPICLEAENATDFQLIDTVAKLISNKGLIRQQRRAACCCCFVNRGESFVPTGKRTGEQARNKTHKDLPYGQLCHVTHKHPI